jgi:hypothetical protein
MVKYKRSAAFAVPHHARAIIENNHFIVVFVFGNVNVDAVPN